MPCDCNLCWHKGISPTVKKGQPRPLTKEFVFDRCNDTLPFEATRVGNWFEFKVDGNTKLDGAAKTAVDLISDRVNP
jgi:hypothetical protein